MALGPTEYKFTVTDVGDYTFTSETRTEDEEHSLNGHGLTLGAWIHAASETLFDTALNSIRDLSTDFSRLIWRTYPGLKGATCRSLDGTKNLGTLEKRGGSEDSGQNVIMRPPRVTRRDPRQADDSAGGRIVVTFKQIAPNA